MPDSWGWSRCRDIQDTVFVFKRQYATIIRARESDRFKFKPQLRLLMASMQL